MLTVNKLPLAEDDLINIWIYGYEQWGITQADHYIEGLGSRLTSLAQSPETCRERKEFSPPVRICPYVSHVIVYTIEDDSILVIRVLHKSMDIERHV
ncbi:MAG: type II toxin-antitoxin system RelE/ParE family toxin [Gammaproteobacteria bacterium]|nr:type II toxin-antitoxin system RelE/ParE family toxin [Gammaproteobacteria bacterium]